MFESIQERRSSLSLRWTPSFAGLLAAAWVARAVCPTPPDQPFIWDSLTGVTAKYAAAVCLTSLCFGWCSAAFLPGEARREARRLALRMSVAALWLAPLLIFLSQRSMWAIPVMGLFAAGVARVLRTDHSTTEGADDASGPNEVPEYGFLSAGLPEPQPARRAAVVTIAAFGQSALVSFLVGVSVAASLFVGLCIALLTCLLPSSLGGPHTPAARWHRSIARPVLSAALAMFLVLVGLTPYLGTGEGAGGWLAFLSNGEGDADTAAEPKTEARKREQRPALGADELVDPLSQSFPGVILWPEARPHVTLVAPQTLTYGRLALDDTKPFSVPFDGVYWFLRSGIDAPPDGAFITRGSPVERTFRTTARTVPLSMLARQNFGGLIDVSCCGRIQVEISNADIHPNTVALNLKLVNTTLPDRPSQSLGNALVRSIPRVTRDNEIIPSRETLIFFIPEDAVLQSFDEAAISFRRDWRRRNESVKVGIDRFVLIPKGSSSIRKRFAPVGPPQRIAD